jgi:hypothetical protein
VSYDCIGWIGGIDVVRQLDFKPLENLIPLFFSC